MRQCLESCFGSIPARNDAAHRPSEVRLRSYYLLDVEPVLERAWRLIDIDGAAELAVCEKPGPAQETGEGSCDWFEVWPTRQLLLLLPVQEQAQFQEAAADYAAKLRDPATRGAVFFAVCRGKVSEGLDFSDRAGRAVVITGLPYAMQRDPKARPVPCQKPAALQQHRLHRSPVTM